MYKPDENYRKVLFFLFLILLSADGLFSASLKKNTGLEAENLKGKVKKYTAIHYQSINGKFTIQDKNIKLFDQDGLILEDEYYKSSNILIKAFKHKYDKTNRVEYIDNNLVYLKSGFESRISYDDAGRIKMTQSGNGITEYFYDANGNETNCLTYRNNELIEETGKKYDAAGHIMEETVVNGKDVSRKVQYVYDKKGLLQSKIEYNFNKSRIYFDYQYDTNGYLSAETVKVYHAGSPVPDRITTSSYNFDERGNEVEKILTVIRTVKRYDKDNHLKQKITLSGDETEKPGTAIEKEIYQYDKEGNMIKIIKYILPAGGKKLRLNEIVEYRIEYY